MIDTYEKYLRYLQVECALTPWYRRYGKNSITKYYWLLRTAEYYTNCRPDPLGRLWARWYRARLARYGLHFGFSIPINTCGPGLSIAHPGTIVVNTKSQIGANCRIHVCVNIGTSGGSNKAPRLGNNIYIGPGAKIFGDIDIADNIAIGANAVVNRSFLEPNATIAGVPARQINKGGSSQAGWIPQDISKVFPELSSPYQTKNNFHKQ